MKHLALIAALALGGCAGDVSFTPAGPIKTSAGSAEIDVTDTPEGCHNWHAQGSITLMDVNIACSRNLDGTFSKTLSVKSADPLQELIDANKNQQAMTQQILSALMAVMSKLAPLPAP